MPAHICSLKNGALYYSLDNNIDTSMSNGLIILMQTIIQFASFTHNLDAKLVRLHLAAARTEK